MKNLLFLSVFLAGCRAIDRGQPLRTPFDSLLQKAILERYKDPQSLIVATPAERNRVIDDFLYLVDRNYYAFESEFHNGGALFETASDLALISVGAVGALIQSSGVKSILAAVSTGIAGMRVSVSKNFLQEQTFHAVISKMRAGRAKKLLIIRQNSELPLETYGISRALSDVEEYYNAGTIVGALRAVVEDAGVELRTAERALGGDNG